MEKNHHIIYIEDDQEMIDLVEIITAREGYDFTGILGGREGLEAVRRMKPDLVLLDLMMPFMDGWEVYHHLKSGKATKDIPVIVITAKAQDIDRVLGLLVAKVDDYIAKPFSPDELIASIKKTLTD